MSEYRLGDFVDDHCSRCRRLTDHSVVAMYSGEVLKTRCRTCDYEHEYRHGKGGKKKQKLSAYEQVLASITPPGPAGRAPAPGNESENADGAAAPAARAMRGRGRSRRQEPRSR